MHVLPGPLDEVGQCPLWLARACIDIVRALLRIGRQATQTHTAEGLVRSHPRGALTAVVAVNAPVLATRGLIRQRLEVVELEQVVSRVEEAQRRDGLIDAVHAVNCGLGVLHGEVALGVDGSRCRRSRIVRRLLCRSRRDWLRTSGKELVGVA